MLKKIIFILFLTCFLGCNLNKLHLTTSQSNKRMITTQEAISLAVDDFQKSPGKLPDKFELIVEEQEDNIIIITLMDYPQPDIGGGLEVTIDKTIGVIISRIATE